MRIEKANLWDDKGDCDHRMILILYSHVHDACSDLNPIGESIICLDFLSSGKLLDSTMSSCACP